MDRGAVYYAKADGSLITPVAFPSITPNGCGLSPDGKTLYFAETESARLWAMDILEPGVVKREGWPSVNGARFLGCPGGYQRFDSLAVDSAGNICVATLINGGITVFSPGRQDRAPRAHAGPAHYQHLFRRGRSQDRLRDAVRLRQTGGVRVGASGPAPQPSMTAHRKRT